MKRLLTFWLSVFALALNAQLVRPPWYPTALTTPYMSDVDYAVTDNVSLYNLSGLVPLVNLASTNAAHDSTNVLGSSAYSNTNQLDLAGTAAALPINFLAVTNNDVRARTMSGLWLFNSTTIFGGEVDGPGLPANSYRLTSSGISANLFSDGLGALPPSSSIVTNIVFTNTSTILIVGATAFVGTNGLGGSGGGSSTNGLATIGYSQSISNSLLGTINNASNAAVAASTNIIFPLIPSTATLLSTNGNGAGLTGISPRQTGSIGTNFATAIPLVTVPAPFSWYLASSFLGSAAGSAITTIPDASGGGRALTGSGVTYVPQGQNGRPGFLFLNGVMTNQNFYPPSANTNCSQWIVWQDFQNSSSTAVIWSSKSNANIGTFTFSLRLAQGGQVNNGTYCAFQTNTIVDGVNINYGGANVYGQSIQGNVFQIYNNGYLGIGPEVISGGSGLVGDFYVGNYPGGSLPFNGLISEILTYTNVLTLEQKATIEEYLCNKYLPQQPQVYFLGDSELKGWGAVSYSNLLTVYNNQSGNQYGSHMLAVGGYTSQQVFDTARTNMLPVLSFGNSPKIAILESGYNDSVLTTCESNILNTAVMLRSNHIQVVVCTTFSTCREINAAYLSGVGGFTNLNNWILANTNLFDAVARFDINTNWGIPGSFATLNATNYYFYEPGLGGNLHLAGGAYNDMAQILRQSIQALNPNAVAYDLNGNIIGNGSAIKGISASQISGLNPSYWTNLFVFGDSYMVGFGATSYTNCFVSQFAQSNNLSINNLSIGGSRICDFWAQTAYGFTYTNSVATNGGSIVTATAPIGPTNYTVYAFDGDGNGAKDYGTSQSYLNYSIAAQRSLMVYLATPLKWLSTNANLSAGWAGWPYYGGGMITTNTTATITFTNVIGSVVYIAYMGSALGDMGGISVNVNGTNFGSFAPPTMYGNRVFEGGTLSNPKPNYNWMNPTSLWMTPLVARIQLPGVSKNTIVVTASGANVGTNVSILWAVGNSQVYPSAGWPLVMAGNCTRLTNYTSTAAGSDLGMALFCSAENTAVRQLQGDGLNVISVPMAEFWDQNSDIQFDGAHPNALGQSSLAQAFNYSFASARQFSPSLQQSSTQSTALNSGYISSLGGIGTNTSFNTITVGTNIYLSNPIGASNVLEVVTTNSGGIRVMSTVVGGAGTGGAGILGGSYVIPSAGNRIGFFGFSVSSNINCALLSDIAEDTFAPGVAQGNQVRLETTAAGTASRTPKFTWGGSGYFGAVGPIVSTNGITAVGGVITGNGSGITNLVNNIQNGTTNATALTSFAVVFSIPMADTNYTAFTIGNGFAVTGGYVSAKTTNGCTFNMGIATGLIDWAAVHK